MYPSGMSTLREIEQAIDRLPCGEAYELGAWLERRLNDNWDKQIESDVAAGRLDQIAQESLKEYRAGNSRSFPADEK
jgi:hypothetical protein